MGIPPIPEASTLPTPPRDVTTTKRAHVFRFFLAALTVLVPFFVVTHGQRERVRLDTLAAEGRQTSGVVTGKSSRKSRHTLRYDYVVDGRTYSDDKQVDRSRYRDTPVGSAVAVTYLPADPNVHEYGFVRPGDGTAAARNKTTLAAILGGAFLIGSLAMEWGIRKDRRLCEYGIEAAGVVTEQKRGKHARTHYAFTSRDGEPIHSATQATHATRMVEVGGTIPVLYDADKPSRNKPVAGISLARVVENH